MALKYASISLVPSLRLVLTIESVRVAQGIHECGIVGPQVHLLIRNLPLTQLQSVIEMIWEIHRGHSQQAHSACRPR
jgi:hypothetical protein